MTNPITTESRPIVGAYGDVYSAPVGTPPPTDINAPEAPWVKMGLISEDGATWTPPEEETSDIKAWQVAYPIRTVTTSLTTSVQFALMEWTRTTIPFALGGGTFEDDGTNTIFHPPAAGASSSRALFLKVLDDPIAMGIYYPKARVSDRGDTSFKTDEPALLDLTWSIEGDLNYEPYQLIFETDTFGDGGTAVAATGASAGTPGSFTPSGAVAPANLAAMGGITASPTTAWTTGQYVLLGDNSHAHWNGTGWIAGDAP